jgi:micrococcal nuclease
MRIVIILIFLMFGTVPVHAGEDNPLAPYSSLKLTASGPIDQVIDPRTLRLQDGTLIHLLGIDIPDLARDPPGDVVAAAYDLANKTAAGKFYNFYQIHQQRVEKNRFGQTLALAVDRATGVSLQDELLTRGLARVWDGDDTGFDLKWLLEQEDLGRQKEQGLWQPNAPTRLMAPDHLSATSIGQLMVITGRIENAVTFDNDIFLCLTERGLKGFTLRLPADMRPALARRNVDPLTWNNRLIRARGIIEPTHGGIITIKNLWQLEMLPDTLMLQVNHENTVPIQKIDAP